MTGPPFEGSATLPGTAAGWALTRLYEWLSPVVAGYLRAQGVQEPDDLTSEVFLGLFSGLGSFTGVRNSSAAGSSPSPTAGWWTTAAKGEETPSGAPSSSWLRWWRISEAFPGGGLRSLQPPWPWCYGETAWRHGRPDGAGVGPPVLLSAFPWRRPG